MTSRRYQKTLNRQQDMLLPDRVEDYVSENNSVRAIDV
jgi:3-hydroxymyristoyl/3-hydroxydecanoyl-(acyl carrier protein) dehydratase